MFLKTRKADAQALFQWNGAVCFRHSKVQGEPTLEFILHLPEIPEPVQETEAAPLMGGTHGISNVTPVPPHPFGDFPFLTIILIPPTIRF